MKYRGLNRTERGRLRRLRRDLAAHGEVIHTFWPVYPRPALTVNVWPADGSPAGHYFVRIEADGSRDVWRSHTQVATERAARESGAG